MSVVVVSNRVVRAKTDEPVAGGLAAALLPMVKQSGATWVGTDVPPADAVQRRECFAEIEPLGREGHRFIGGAGRVAREDRRAGVEHDFVVALGHLRQRHGPEVLLAAAGSDEGPEEAPVSDHGLRENETPGLSEHPHGRRDLRPEHARGLDDRLVHE